MLEDGSPALEVGFVIDTSASFDSMARLETALDKATSDAIAEIAKVEKAVGGMLNMGGATASITSFGAAATREMQATAREIGRVEKSGEAMVRSLERQNTAFGKSREELRGMKAESAALAAEQKGLAELAQRIRDQEAALYGQEIAAANQARAAAEAAAQAKADAAARAVAASQAEAQALREASFAYGQFEAAARRGMQALREQEAAEKAANRDAAAAQIQREAAAAKQLADEHARLAAMVRGSQAAQEADAVAAERLRASTDPLYAATSRLNAEIAESTRLYHAGATAPTEYARQQQVLTERLVKVSAAHDATAAAARRGAGSMTQLSFQLNDVATQAALGTPAFQIFASQIGQIVQVAQMAEGGLKGFAAEVSLLALRLSPLIVVAGMAYGAIKLFQAQVKDDGDLTRYRDNLGLTHKEMLQLSDGVETAGGKIKELGGVTVTVGDVMSGLWKTVKDDIGDQSAWAAFKDGAVSAFKIVIDAWGVTAAGITAGIYGTANAAKLIWNNFATSVGDVFYQAVNIAIDAMNRLVEKGTDILNGFIHGANMIPGVNIGNLTAPKISTVHNPYAGAASNKAGAAVIDQIAGGYRKAYADARAQDTAFWKQVGDNARQSAKDRMKAEANALIANRTPKKTSDHGLADSLAQLDAQIKGQWALAAAYQVSDAAAIKAEALQKAEEQAIRHKGEAGIFYEKELALAVAQAAASTAKHIADLGAQASAQQQVNDAIAAGVLPASQMSQALQENTEKRQLLAAIAVAEEKGWTDQVVKLKGELANLGKVQADNYAQANRAQVLTSTAAGQDQLAHLQLEAKLIGATNEARAVAIAQLEAEQYLAAHPGATAAEAQHYIDMQKQIALQTVQGTQAQDAYNASLTETADRWEIIAGKVQSAAQGMADAFGNVGRAIGDLASTYANYQASQQRALAEHEAAITKAGSNEKLIAQENSRFALKSAGAQVGAYGDMAAAAKGFFKEGSAGYEALAAAEKAFRIVQFAMSVQAMIQNAAETLGFVTNAAARATAEGTAGIASQSKLPFPLNIVAMAATGAALLAAGVALIGGGHSSSSVPVTNTGTGTVLGDASAKSESIKRSIDQLKEVDTLMLTSSRAMAASLRSIDAQISGFAAEILKAGDINASGGIAEGFKPNIIGSVLGSIPLIGGLLKSLFGTTTKVTGNGLFGGPQSIGDILAGGFDAQYYSDIEKTSKFFGITTGHSTSTQYTGADPALAAQFTLILKSFDDAILAAAGPLGLATDDIKNRLNGFVVDIGKIDLQGLTGEEIQEKLSAVFGAAADKMAEAAIPGLSRFQQVGEGAFETLIRVASTVEAVTASLDELGTSTAGLGIDEKMGLAGQFDSIGDFTSAVDAFFQAFYTPAEQAAAKTAQLGKVFASLGLAMPATLAGFRALVEAQDLTTAAGEATYATLLQLAPAFADLQAAMNGAKSAADILSEREDLNRQLLELQGNTPALRALDLAKLDASNRALQEQIWLIQDAQDAVQAAEELRAAWASIGDSIEDEVKRIRGLTDNGSTDFATAQSDFNIALAAARGGDQDAAKSLPGLSQALLSAAALVATSRQELDRVQAQTATSLQSVLDWINSGGGSTSPTSVDDLLDAVATAGDASTPSAATDDMASEIRALRDEVAALRSDNNAGHAASASAGNRSAKVLENVSAPTGGTAINVSAAA